MDNSFYKFIIMTQQNKLDAIKSLHKMIAELKKIQVLKVKKQYKNYNKN